MMKSQELLNKSFTLPTLLIDGDLYLFRSAIAVEHEIDWGDDVWSLATDLKRQRSYLRPWSMSSRKNLLLKM